jgi:hypothetical protein
MEITAQDFNLPEDENIIIKNIDYLKYSDNYSGSYFGSSTNYILYSDNVTITSTGNTISAYYTVTSDTVSYGNG